MSLIQKMFKNTNIIRLKVGNRVKHTRTFRMGRIVGTVVVKGSCTVNTVSVRYDDGTLSNMAVETEFIIIG